MDFHPIANLWPIDDDGIPKLADDIKTRGQLETIKVFDGQVLDGRRRWMACTMAGVKPRTEEVNPADPLRYAFALNEHRRHEEPGARAAVGLSVLEYEKEQAKERRKRKPADFVPAPSPEQKGEARDRAGALVGVSGRTIDRAARVQADGTPELFEAMKSGEIPVTTAAGISRLPKELQPEATEKARCHVSNNSGNNEWYTPAIYLEAAREVLGVIDLDPASAKVAQRLVKATKFYTADDDGLKRKWNGRVWLNPPYSADLVGKFLDKLLSHTQSGDVTAAVVLVNNATDTKWFQAAASSSSAVCFTAGRIKYLDNTGEPKNTPVQGQAFLYFGAASAKFVDVFQQFGFCAEVCADA